MEKNYLITGGCGFIGTNFIRHALTVRPDWSIINLDALTYAGNPANLENLDPDIAERYRFVQGDIRNAKLLDSLFSEYDFNGIIHFAAESHVDRSINGPEDFVETVEIEDCDMNLIFGCKFVITDSGGIQEETTYLKKFPV
ncbi:hypothetical protein ES705_26760 [subsurface metagenome]